MTVSLPISTSDPVLNRLPSTLVSELRLVWHRREKIPQCQSITDESGRSETIHLISDSGAHHYDGHTVTDHNQPSHQCRGNPVLDYPPICAADNRTCSVFPVR